MNHPALKELSVRAPGTYHHSIVVGNLAESAAEGIAANALLVRVASYYHDLGKMLCPLYFVENQNNRNYHDDLPARTSAQIIISHVKNGAEIAKRHRLGKAIGDILEQHHGTGLVRYFFHKAQEEQADLGQPPQETDFRYPGPKPQTKESGLVMLADVTESAARSLEDPSEDAIRQMVKKQATRTSRASPPMPCWCAWPLTITTWARCFAHCTSWRIRTIVTIMTTCRPGPPHRSSSAM